MEISNYNDAMAEKVLISIQLDPDTRRRLRVLSAETGRPIRALLTDQIDRLLATSEPKPTPDHASRKI